MFVASVEYAVFPIRRQQEAELKQLEEETARRLEEAIRKNVEERLASDEVKLEIERRIEEGRKKLFEDVKAQLDMEKEAALVEARRKEVSSLASGLNFISFHLGCHMNKNMISRLSFGNFGPKIVLLNE